MTGLFESVFAGFRVHDAIDILLVAIIVYRVFVVLRGSHAIQVLVGLIFLSVLFALSKVFGLATIDWLLRHLFDSFFLIIIVLFQDDLRRALTFVSKNTFVTSKSDNLNSELVNEIAKAASQLAQKRMGGLIVIERENGLKNFIDTGAQIDAIIRSELIYSIFIPSSPIHDGAVIIQNGKLAAAGCFLPLTKNPNIDKTKGTRHRAALGLSEETDAVVVLISEESGSVHIVKAGRLSAALSEEELGNSLAVILEISDYGRRAESIEVSGTSGAKL